MNSPGFDQARTRQITFAQLQTLLAIRVSGSLVAAAEALNMTPAALTARVKGWRRRSASRCLRATRPG